MATIKAVILDAPGPPDALQIPDLPILTPGPEEMLIKVAAFGLNWSRPHTSLGLAQDLPRRGIEPNGQGAVRRMQHFGHPALRGPLERGPAWHHLPHPNTGVVGLPATVGVAAQPIQTVC
jgi:hypothetical protein